MSVLSYPQGGDYQIAMQDPAHALCDAALQRGTVEMRQDRRTVPAVRSGGFVYTYHLLLPDGKEKAIRCYGRPIADLFARYEQIIPVTGRAPDLFLPTTFAREGIVVNGQRYPLMAMDWVQGETLNNWIVRHLTPQAIGSLIPQCDRLLERMEQVGIAHGDLQHGNILVDGQGQLRLIDYDSLYVPALKGLPAADVGHRNFQHPQRQGEFDERLDRFPGIVIGLALRALQAEPALWDEFGLSGENLLFTREDFLAPDQSPLLARMERVPAVAPYIPNFRTYCLARYADVPRPGAFFATTAPVQVRHATRPAPRWTATTPVIAADDVAGLLRHAGEYVEVIGRVREVYRSPADTQGNPYAQLIFTKRSGFVAMIFSPHLAAFDASGRDPKRTYEGQWVTMTLVLTTFASEGSTLPPRPQVLITAPADIGILTEGQVRTRLSQLLQLPKGFTADRSTPPVTPPLVHPPTVSPPVDDEQAYLERAQQHWGNRTMSTLPSPNATPGTSVASTPFAQHLANQASGRSTLSHPSPASPVMQSNVSAPQAASHFTGWRAWWQQVQAGWHVVWHELFD